ncbi:MAG TPA: ABC transporter permease subunit [Aggregatilinea sp.]|jgi:ABC-2 type transport system permease protein|uniref:ABC transporter permease subunit n=1 Tax=Aggregatilinea sp. TaxID=2806333 RepID=UPI002BF09564|nr:ABC transporter permease subunit [Aggregatilinea sp.]HML22675.1 ABC transporter permease subunit [Aggregatilinea sp.]
MQGKVFLKTLRDMRGALIAWTIGMFLTGVLFMSFYPAVRDSMGQVEDLLDRMPATVRALAGEATDFSTVNGYLSTKALSSFFPVLVLAFTISYGASLIGGEEETGTLDLLLATPTPRWRIVLEKFAALVLFTVVALVAAYAGVVLGSIPVDAFNELNLGRLLAGVLDIAPMGLFFGALTLAITCVRPGRGTALGTAAGLAGVTYLLDTMAELAGIPKAIQVLSPWYHFNGDAVLVRGVNAGSVALLLGLAAALVVVAMIGFERRDAGV